MSKNFISRSFDAVLAAKLAIEKKLQAAGRAWASNTAKKQKLIDQGKMDVTRYLNSLEFSRMTPVLDIDKKAAIFRKLASGTLYEVGVEFELDKHYKDAVAVRNKVYNIYREVSQEPEKFFVHPDTVALVVEAVSKRKVATRTSDTMLETQEKLKESDIKSLTISSRDKAGKLINHKLSYLESHPKALVGESLVTLGKIFGILFDKAQIITGQATEHVAILSKLDPNMSTEEAIQAVIRGREINQMEKYG